MSFSEISFSFGFGGKIPFCLSTSFHSLSSFGSCKVISFLEKFLKILKFSDNCWGHFRLLEGMPELRFFDWSGWSIHSNIRNNSLEHELENLNDLIWIKKLEFESSNSLLAISHHPHSIITCMISHKKVETIEIKKKSEIFSCAKHQKCVKEFFREWFTRRKLTQGRVDVTQRKI